MLLKIFKPKYQYKSRSFHIFIDTVCIHAKLNLPLYFANKYSIFRSAYYNEKERQIEYISIRNLLSKHDIPMLYLLPIYKRDYDEIEKSIESINIYSELVINCILYIIDHNENNYLNR